MKPATIEQIRLTLKKIRKLLLKPKTLSPDGLNQEFDNV